MYIFNTNTKPNVVVGTILDNFKMTKSNHTEIAFQRNASWTVENEYLFNLRFALMELGIDLIETDTKQDQVIFKCYRRGMNDIIWSIIKPTFDPSFENSEYMRKRFTLPIIENNKGGSVMNDYAKYLTEEDKAKVDELYKEIGKSMNEIKRQEVLIDKFMDEIENIIETIGQ